MDASDAAPQRVTDAHGADARRAWIGRIACVIVPIVIWLAPLPLEPLTKHGMAIAAFMILGWATEATGMLGASVARIRPKRFAPDGRHVEYVVGI